MLGLCSVHFKSKAFWRARMMCRAAVTVKVYSWLAIPSIWARATVKKKSVRQRQNVFIHSVFVELENTAQKIKGALAIRV